ncbi:MAG: hypothetical protein IT163_05035 [Bryobacterales bacterium]|nr:hypothetical protein [Bryobacterales bacterium]
MAKYKIARKAGKNAPQTSNTRGLIGCISLLTLGFALFFLLFYAMLKGS